MSLGQVTDENTPRETSLLTRRTVGEKREDRDPVGRRKVTHPVPTYLKSIEPGDPRLLYPGSPGDLLSVTTGDRRSGLGVATTLCPLTPKTLAPCDLRFRTSLKLERKERRLMEVDVSIFMFLEGDEGDTSQKETPARRIKV